MAYIVVGILLWIAAAIAIALILGRAIKIADNHEREGSAARLRIPIYDTVTRA